MKKLKSVMGVTLLEIMLVLAVAAMVIVMSIKYYKSASEAQNVNALVEAVHGIIGAADTYAQSSGSGYAGLTATNITNVAGSNALNNPFGAPLTLGAATATTYTIGISGMPTTACAQFILKVQTNSKITIATPCTTLTYNSQN